MEQWIIACNLKYYDVFNALEEGVKVRAFRQVSSMRTTE